MSNEYKNDDEKNLSGSENEKDFLPPPHRDPYAVIEEGFLPPPDAKQD